MSHAHIASTPNTGNALGSTTSYANPDGATSTTPTAPPCAISLTSYNSSQVNRLLDICGYAASAQYRTAYVFIQKPAYYWLTLSAPVLRTRLAARSTASNSHADRRGASSRDIRFDKRANPNNRFGELRLFAAGVRNADESDRRIELHDDAHGRLT
jgi:hypothetical protein